MVRASIILNLLLQKLIVAASEPRSRQILYFSTTAQPTMRPESVQDHNAAIHLLPETFSGRPVKDVYIHFYHTSRPSVNSKIIFNTNLIGFALKGIKEVRSATDARRVGNKEILLLPANSVLMSEYMQPDEPFESILLFFSNDFLRQCCLRYQLLPDKQQPSGNCAWTVAKNDFLYTFEQSLQVLRTGGLAALATVKAEELLVYLLTGPFRDDARAFVQRALAGDTDRQLKEVIATHAGDRLTIEELAFLCHMSVSSFKRHFRAVYGTSPQKYFAEQRMQQACRMLSLDRTPSDIYMELGYGNLSSFSSEFRKYTGLSPRQYQQKKNELPA